MRPPLERLPHPKVCNVCNHDVIILTTRTAPNWPWIWECDKCKASVGCHHGTYNPLGLLAPSNLRMKRIQAHTAFDPIWQKKLMHRHQAYEWLASKLKISRDNCHISLMDEWQLERVIAIAYKFMKPENLTQHRREQKRNVRHAKQRKRQIDRIVRRKDN